MDFTFISVDKITFGQGHFSDVAREASAFGTRVLLVAGRGSLRRSGRLAQVEDLCRVQGLRLSVFDAVPPEPTLGVVEQGISMLREQRCDVVVAVGGGSALDVGKVIAGLGNAPGSVQEYFQGREVTSPGFSFIAIPTTAGSGSEVTPNAVLIDTENGVKASIRNAHLLADVAIVDPELMLTCPPDVTAFSGMDALCQALEALVSRGAAPLTDALALDAAVRLIRNLRDAYEHGDDVGLRGEVALGSLMGAMAFSNARLGLVHGLAHPIGVQTGLPHGLLCGLLLPPVMRFNMPVSAAKYADVARRVRVADSGASDEAAGSALVTEIERMNAEMGLDAHKSKLRIPEEKWPEVVAQTLSSGSTKSNPREVAASDIHQMLASI